MLSICWLGVVISDVADVFAVSLCQVTPGLPFIWHVAILAGEFLYSTSIIDWYLFLISWVGCLSVPYLLFYGRCVIKGLVSFLTFEMRYVNVTHYLLYSSLVVFVWTLCCICVFSLVMCVFGKLLFCAMVCIIFQSVCLLSSLNGNESILFI